MTQLVLTLDPIPAIALFSAEDNTLMVYSLTGQFITEKKLRDPVAKMLCGKDINSLDVLVVLGIGQTLSFYSLPYLEETKKRLQLSHTLTGDFEIAKDSGSLFLAGDREIIVCQP